MILNKGKAVNVTANQLSFYVNSIRNQSDEPELINTI